jgi:hypothetical protein
MVIISIGKPSRPSFQNNNTSTPDQNNTPSIIIAATAIFSTYLINTPPPHHHPPLKMDLGPFPLSAPFSWSPTISSTALTKTPLYVVDIPEMQMNGWAARKNRHRPTIHITQTVTVTVTEIVYTHSSMIAGEVVSLVSTGGVASSAAGSDTSYGGFAAMSPIFTSAATSTTTSTSATHAAPIISPPDQFFQSAPSHHYTNIHTLAKRDGNLCTGAIIGVVVGIIGGLCLLWGVIVWIGEGDECGS